jgi:hypothetical protein
MLVSKLLLALRLAIAPVTLRPKALCSRPVLLLTPTPVMAPDAPKVPVKLALLDIVCPLIRPAAIVPILTKLPVESIRLVPAPAPVLMPVVPFRVVPVIVLLAVSVVPDMVLPVAIVPKLLILPLVIMPRPVMLPCTALGRVWLSEGTLPALVTSIELAAGAVACIAPASLPNSMPLAARVFVPVPPLATLKAVARLRLAKVGLEIVLMFWGRDRVMLPVAVETVI